jgi:hypothetical protein
MAPDYQQLMELLNDTEERVAQQRRGSSFNGN